MYFQAHTGLKSLGLFLVRLVVSCGLILPENSFPADLGKISIVTFALHFLPCCTLGPARRHNSTVLAIRISLTNAHGKVVFTLRPVMEGKKWRKI